MIILGLLLLNQSIYLENATLYTQQLEIFCEKATLQHITRTFKFDIIDISIQKLSYYVENTKGKLFLYSFEAENLHLRNPNLEIKNLCFSICGFECPQTGVFLHTLHFSDKNEKIELKNVSIKAFEREILSPKIYSLILPKKLDLYGKSPGLSNPNIAISKKHGIIIGGEFFIPFSYFRLPNLDLTISSTYFSERNLIFGGVSADYESENENIKKLNSKLVFNSPSLFSFTGDTLLLGNIYHIGARAYLATRQFLSIFPADIQIAGLPFSSYGNEINIYALKLPTIKISLTNTINLFSEHITYYNLFSETSANFQSEIANISAGIFSTLPHHSLYPFVKGNFSYKGMRVLGRIFGEYQKLSVSAPGIPIIFHSFRFYEYLYDEIFGNPSFLSLAYEWWIDSHSIHIGGSNLFPDISLVPELGFSSPILSFSTLSTSAGLLYSKDKITPLFLFIINYLPRILSGETSFIYFRGKFLGKQSLYSNFSIQNLKFSLSFNFFATNSSGEFIFRQNTNQARGENEKKEYFTSIDLNIIFRDLNLSLSYISYIIAPTQISALLGYNLRKFCSEIYINGLYNFTQKGEPRIGFGIRANL